MAVQLPNLETQTRPTPQPAGGLASYRGASGAETARGEAAASAGEATRHVASALQSEADRIYQQVKIEQEKADTTRVEDAWNQYKNAALDVTMGEKGVLKLKGADAVNGDVLKSTPQRLADARQRVSEALGNDEQRLRFNQRADATDLQVKHQVLQHLDAEHKEYAKATIMGSEAAARSQINAMPLNNEVFTQAKETLLMQADAYLKLQGVTDKGAMESYRAKMVDQLWKTRIDALLYSQPVLAEAMLRANEKEITNPELKLQLQAQTREASLGVSAAIEATKIFDDVRSRVPPATAPRDTFQDVVGSLLKREGGYNPSDGKSGAPVNFGINQKANPDIDVRGLTRERAIALYKERYWDKIDGDNLAPATALVALDAAALQGPGVARKLIDATGGDPLAMIAMRRQQLQALAASDPEHAKNLKQWMTRMDGLEAEVKTMPDGGMRKVSQNDPFVANTNGLPNSRDVAAQLPRMLLQVEKTATDRFGPDVQNPDRQAFVRRLESEVRNRVSLDVQQLNSLQREAQGKMIDAVMGMAPSGGGMVQTGGGRGGAPNAPITSFAQVQADPNLMRQWQMLDPAAKEAFLIRMERNQHAGEQGDVQLFRDLFNRVHLDSDNPNKIFAYQQVIDPRYVARLSNGQIQQLRMEIDRQETPGGRSLGQMRRGADGQVANYFKTNIMFTAQPERAIEATMRWNQDVGAKVDEYMKQGKTEAQIRSLFQVDSPDSMVSPKFLQGYVTTTPAGGLHDAAGAQKEPGPAPQPPAIDSREKLDAWLKTLPPEVTTFTGADGKVRYIPGRKPVPADAGKTLTEMNDEGKLISVPGPEELQRKRSRFAPEKK